MTGIRQPSFVRRLLQTIAICLGSTPALALAIVQSDYDPDAKPTRTGVMQRAVLIRYTAINFAGGSGVIVGPRHVLTAKHGADRWSPNQLTVDLADDAKRRVKVAGIHLHPNPKVDLALLELAEAVDFDLVPVLDRKPVTGDRVWIGGFGIYGAPGKPRGFGTFHAGYNTVDNVRGGRARIVLDRDAKTPEALPAAFDSGSPVWVETDDGWRLSGVTVTASGREGPNYGDRSHHEMLAPELAWFWRIVKPAVAKGETSAASE